MVIWITGLSASGKTTLCKTFENKYRTLIPNLVILDGDSVRELYGNDLGFTERDRQKQIGRMQSISEFLEKQSLIVMVAALYSNNDLLNKNRNIFSNYYEIYLKAEINQLQKREFKGLYKNALLNNIKNVVGVDIPWHEPIQPNLIFDITKGLSPCEMAETIYNSLFLK
jgi:adenylylsulfate kinase-like enzyme